MQHTPITPTTTFASLDICNMYSNIPVMQRTQNYVYGVKYLKAKD